MDLLSRYLMRTILSSAALVLAVLLALAALFQFIGNLDDVQGDFGIPQALLYSALRLPQISFEMLPMAALIGSLLGLGSLANSSELVVMRTAGWSWLVASMVVSSGPFWLRIVRSRPPRSVAASAARPPCTWSRSPPACRRRPVARSSS